MSDQIVLVKAIERFPCLYNYKLAEYTKKENTEKAWNEVANETKLTVAECKEKWKNIRYGFIRSLRPNQDGSTKKKYYLHDEMEFVLPFIKYFPRHVGSMPQPLEGETDEEIIVNLSENVQTPQFEFDIIQNHEPPTKRFRTHDSNHDDSRKMFLLSLLPEINKLTDNQMRSFRRKVLALIDEIVDTPNKCDYNIIYQWHKEQTQDADSVQNDITIKTEVS